MATRSIKTRLELENEAQYKQSLKEISSGMSVLKSEMNKVSAEFKGNETSIEALTAKNDVLNRQILTQKDRVEVLRKALEDAAKAYGESDTRTQSWQVKLNNAEADLAKMENQLKENNAAIEQNGKATESNDQILEKFIDTNKGLGDALNEVANQFGVHLPNGITQAVNGFGKIDTKLAVTVGALAGLVTVLTKVESKLMDTTKKSAEFVDSINTLSTNTSISAETLLEWEYAAQLIDVDVSTLTGSMTKMISQMSKAASGTEKSQQAFSSLGVSIYDASGHLRDSEDVFKDVIDALGEIENATERDAASMEIFGKSAQDLNSLIVQGTDTLQGYAEEAHNIGYILSTEDLEALQSVDDAQQRLLSTQEAVANQLSAQFAPAAADALGTMRDCLQEIGQKLVESGIVNALGSMLTSVVSLIEPLTALGELILPAISGPLKIIATLCATIVDSVNLLVGIMPWNWGSGIASTALGLNQYEASNLQKAYYGADYKTANYNSDGNRYDPETGLFYGNYYNASGSDNFRGGLTWVGENGPELVNIPRGSAISTAQESRAAGGDTFIINVTANKVKEFNDLVSMAQNERRLVRMGGTY